MKVLVVFALALVAVQATSDEELWHQFKVEHGKTYRDLYEEKQRFTIFQSNLKTIEEHNAKYENGEESYFMKVTRFADMTPEEFQDFLLLSSKSIPEVGDAIWEAEEGVAAPASFDWREKGAVLGVKNQGACGSCWAFSATGCLEGQLAIKQKKKISLSEQNLMDCSSSYGNGACNGGLMTSAFRYVHDHGINSEADYPYETKKGSCRFNRNKSVTKVGKIYSVAKSEDALKEIIATVGPISVGIDASSLSLYGGGVYNPKSCSSTQLNHGVLAVGYGGADKQQYWIVKNSWGTGWGEKGYVRMTRHLEGQLAIKFKQYISLSAQNLVDCSKENSGCNGGNMLEAYDYVRQFGIESEGDYPYEKRRSTCRADNEHIVTKVSGILRIHPSKDEVQKAVASIGPIAVAIDSSGLQLYGGGIYTPPNKCPRGLNHAVLIVGYGSDGYGKDYWIMKNSWGVHWGEAGYGMVEFDVKFGRANRKIT